MRKLLLFTLLMALFTMTAVAQESPIDKGSMIVGGTIGFQMLSGDAYDVDDESYTAISVMPEFGYFVSPGLVVGGELLYSSESQGDYIDNSTFGIGPMIGYYFNTNKESTEIKGALYPYIKGFFIYQSLSMGDFDITTMSFGGKAGINYMLTDAVALDAGIRVLSDSWEPDGGDSVSGMNIMFSGGIQAFIF